MTVIPIYENHPNPYHSYSFNHHLSDPTIIFDVSGKIQFFNAEILKLLNLLENDLKEKNIKNILPDFNFEELQSSQKSDVYFSFKQKTFLNQIFLVMIHSFSYLDKTFFCAQFKRSFCRALIVDDDEICRRIVKKFLSELKFASIEATNGFEALGKLDSVEKGTSVDVVVTDFSMPTMDGLTQAKKFRKKTDKKTPFILNTSDPITIDFKKRCKKKNRFQKVLSKPLDRKKLLTILEKMDFPIKK